MKAINNQPIVEYLEKTGESQNAFAKRSGVSQTVVWRWVNCQRMPGMENIIKAAAAMGIKTSTLVRRLYS
jgi:transcriptional regulator with XRE-family HTH domain